MKVESQTQDLLRWSLSSVLILFSSYRSVVVLDRPTDPSGTLRNSVSPRSIWAPVTGSWFRVDSDTSPPLLVISWIHYILTGHLRIS